MMTIDLPPQEEVARQFMRHKGYDIEPTDVEALDDIPCWYFMYNLPEGVLELEVFWNNKVEDWETTVTTFTLSE